MKLGENGEASEESLRNRRGGLRDMLSWLGLASLLLGIGIFLTWKAYTDSAISSGQVSVTVYVTINPAHVSIKSHAYLNPRYDSIDVNVTGPKAMKDPWLIVVKCPAGAKTPKGDTLLSEGTAGLQQLGYERQGSKGPSFPWGRSH